MLQLKDDYILIIIVILFSKLGQAHGKNDFVKVFKNLVRSENKFLSHQKIIMEKCRNICYNYAWLFFIIILMIRQNYF